MNERITLISLFDDHNMKKIMNYIDKIDDKICKVPYGKNVSNREDVDTLPYHFTLYAFDIKKENEVKNYLKTKIFTKVKVEVDKIDIIDGKEDSYVLLFHMKENEDLKKIQRDIFNEYPSGYYNPAKFQFHITIDISKDKKKEWRIKKLLEDDFVPFELEISRFGLFEIYPAKLVDIFNC